MDNEFVEQLKTRIDIVDIVSKATRLSKAGSNYKGLCPFHSEKTASFIVSPGKQLFNCFGCGEKGDAISFVEKFYKLNFLEAVERICNDYGIEMPKQSGTRVNYDKYYQINALAAKFYYMSLGTPHNKGYAYLRKRGLKDETIKQFALGYAGDSWDSLVKHLREKGVSDEDMLKLSLATESSRGLIDKFRNRVIFPIVNNNNKVIGFGGRAITDVKPKYLNSAESDVFLKKNNLFGLNHAKETIIEQDMAIIVEGYMDVISLHEHGIKNAIASLGTALTDNQARLIGRYTKNIVLCYDSDNAGVSAAIRGIDIIRSADCRVSVLNVPGSKDPDEYIRANDKTSFINLAKNAISGTDFLLENAAVGLDISKDSDKLKYISKCVEILKKLGPVEMDLQIDNLSNKLNISKEAIRMEIESKKQQKTINNKATNKTNQEADNDSLEKVEISLLVLALQNTTYLDKISIDNIKIQSALGQKLYAIIQNLHSKDPGAAMLNVNIVEKSLESNDANTFMKYYNNTKLGSDDNRFYINCKNAILLKEKKLKKLELLNRLEVSEQFKDNQQEITDIAKQLMEIEQSITELKGGTNG